MSVAKLAALPGVRRASELTAGAGIASPEAAAEPVAPPGGVAAERVALLGGGASDSGGGAAVDAARAGLSGGGLTGAGIPALAGAVSEPGGPVSVGRSGATALAGAVSEPGAASRVAVARDRVQVTERLLPVRPELRGLLPQGGLRRGSTVAVRGSASLLLALLAEATATGSWAAVVGMPDLGLVAAGEFGVEVGRLALVPRPGAELASVTAALLDGMDLVAVAPGGTAPSVARRLSARARHRGSVLLSLGPWPGAELELGYETGQWTGLASGAGHLRARWAEIRIAGRGSATRPRYAELMLPGPAEATDRRAPAPGPAASAAPRSGWEHAEPDLTWVAEDVG